MTEAGEQTVRPRSVEPVVDVDFESLQVRLAADAAEIDAAQALRYRVFYEEMGAEPTPEMAHRRRDFDHFDSVCDHLLVLDHAKGAGAAAVVGTYRLLRRAMAAKSGGFYSAAEYDLGTIGDFPARSSNWDGPVPTSRRAAGRRHG